MGIKEIEGIKDRSERASGNLRDDEIYLSLGSTKLLLSHIEELEEEVYHLNNILLEQSYGYFPQYRKRTEQAEARIKELEGEHDQVDKLLARRTALDSEPTRYAKIAKTIHTAKQADIFEAKVKELEEGIQEIINSEYMNSLVIKEKLDKLVEKEKK